MKVIWLTNFGLPSITSDIGSSPCVNEGWLVYLSKLIVATPELELVILCPQTIKSDLLIGNVDGFKYYAFPILKNREAYDPNLMQIFIKILKKLKPDVIHIMGSEYPHSLSMLQACEKCKILGQAVISIQGLVSFYEKHYCLGLPPVVQFSHSVRDMIKKDNPENGRKKFAKRGKYEIAAFQLCPNVIGRTEWDYACAKQLNKKIKYYFNNETLRPSFYEKSWSYDSCIKHSIFCSQATYPIKGIHFMFEALSIVKNSFPDVKLYIAGATALKKKRYAPKWRRNAYENYLFKIINKWNLWENIVPCGALGEIKMRDQYLKANVFVSPSTIENSPNSVGEAMILGIPVIATDVGGVSSILKHGEEGYCYPADEPYMLAHYICKIFGNTELALRIGQNARRRALVTHNPENNIQTLIKIYKKILACKVTK